MTDPLITRRLGDALRVADGSRPAIITGGETIAYADWLRRAEELAGGWSTLRQQSVGLMTDSTPDALAAMAALDMLEARVTLLDPRLSPDVVRDWSRELQWSGWLSPSPPDNGWHLAACAADGSPAASSTVTILTSGTEGRPRAVHHTWNSLFRPVRLARTAVPQRWLLAYRPYLYAGLQVMAQSVANGDCLVMPTADAGVDEITELFRRGQVSHASATPSYWRRLLLFARPDAWTGCPLRQVTLGGEPVDQLLLDQLRRTFPQARLAHIYATTELGRCFSVTDGRAGFPRSYLEPSALPDVQLQIREGELLVQSANRGQLATPSNSVGANDWMATGDLVDVTADRVLFAGRRGDMINVGGLKVQPLRVESVVRNVPGVRDVLVYGQSSSIAGSLVACQIMLETGAEPEEVRRGVTGNLPRAIAASRGSACHRLRSQHPSHDRRQTSTNRPRLIPAWLMSQGDQREPGIYRPGLGMPRFIDCAGLKK